MDISLTVSPIRDAAGHDDRRVENRARHQRARNASAWRRCTWRRSSSRPDDAIVSKDLNGIVQSWNPAAERLFGYTAAEMIGQSITKMVPQDR